MAEGSKPQGGDKAASNAATSAGIWCLIYGCGIIGCLLVYGVIQERIMSEPYDGVFFRTSVFMVLCNRIVAMCYACSMIKVRGEDMANKAPLWKYLAISFSNVAATWCQYEALKYVSFPVQMLGKSFKMMPVMLWGIVISQKKYGAQDWAIAGGVTGGVTMFLLSGDIKAKHGNPGTSSYGLMLLGMFLACDGFTSTFQEKLFKEHKTSKYNQMLYVNSGSAIVSAFTLFSSGAAPKSIAFCFEHPVFFVHAMSLSLAACGGQWFIYSQVKEFGALVLACTMNTRQVISILVSYVMYSHPISVFQFLALCMVFGTLFAKSYMAYLKKKMAELEKAKQTAVPDMPDEDPIKDPDGKVGPASIVLGRRPPDE